MMDMLNAMSLEQLDALIVTVRELTEAKKAAQRRDEIIAELTDLFAELDELGVEYYFGAPARNGGIDCYVMTGNVILDEDEIIIS